jgi:hypothetical protein
VDAVVNESVGALATLDQMLVHRLPKGRMHLVLGLSQNGRKHRNVSDVAKASELQQRALRIVGQPL